MKTLEQVLETEDIPKKLLSDIKTVTLSAKTRKRLKTVKRFMELRNELLEHSAHQVNPVFAANAQRIAGLWDEAVSNALITLGSRVAGQGVKHE